MKTVVSMLTVHYLFRSNYSKHGHGGEDMAEMWIEAIGLFAGLLGIIAWIPQIREVWVNKRHDGISLPTFSIVMVALALWLVYGILVKSIAMIVANVLTLMVIFTVIAGVVRLRRSEAV